MMASEKRYPNITGYVPGAIEDVRRRTSKAAAMKVLVENNKGGAMSIKTQLQPLVGLTGTEIKHLHILYRLNHEDGVVICHAQSTKRKSISSSSTLG